MREIKFRAFYEFGKEMIYWDEVKNWICLQLNENDPDFHLMQYTGLKDKNGKEIYEGDILECDWKDERYPVHNIGPVEWDKDAAGWSLGEGASPSDDAQEF